MPWFEKKRHKKHPKKQSWPQPWFVPPVLTLVFIISWAQNKINRTCKDDPTGHCTRREKERQTEKEMGRQRNGVDRIKVG